MPSFDCSNVPRCTIDFPLDITPEEIVSLSGPVNTLLKSSYLVGASLETDATFDSLFDIAEEIAGVEACGLLLASEHAQGSWDMTVGRRVSPSLPPERLHHLIAPAAIVSRFDKAVSMDPDWGGWSRPICEAWASRSLVAFPLRRDRDVVGALVFGKKESHPFTTVQMKLLWVLSMQGENVLLRNDAAKTLSFYSFLDPLTHLNNRRYFDSHLEMEILRSRRTGYPFSLLMLDLDGFKAYNDRFLHTSGDIALQEFAGILAGSVREVDTSARLGGDEFAVILLESNAEGAQALAERIIERFRRHLLPGTEGARTERLSVSVGIASFPADSFDKVDLVSKADRALFAAKSDGGGCVRMYHTGVEPGMAKGAPQEIPVRKIYDASRSVVDMDRFLEILLLTGMQGMCAGRGSIVVKDAAGDFTLKAAIGFSRHEEHIAGSGIIRPGAVTSWVVDHQVPLVVSTPDDSPLPPPRKKNGYCTDSFLSVPLTHNGRTLGVLHLTNRKDQRPFTREDLQAFAPIASEIAGILEQGMSFRQNVKTFALSILGSLSSALELRFPFLSGHSSRVRDLSVRVGERIGISPSKLDALRVAAELHDVGIVGIPGSILSKKRRLNDQELEITRKHPYFGAKMLEGVPGLETARRAILEHHENFDGSGYPYGLGRQDISIPARILHVAEFYDSVVSDRPHRGAFSSGEALDLVIQGSGTLFDQEVSTALVAEVTGSRGTAH